MGNCFNVVVYVKLMVNVIVILVKVFKSIYLVNFLFWCLVRLLKWNIDFVVIRKFMVENWFNNINVNMSICFK